MDQTWSWLPSLSELEEWLAQKKEKREGAKLSHSNHRFRISGNLAVAVYDQLITYSDGRVNASVEIKVLEKLDGAWKITLGSAHFYSKD